MPVGIKDIIETVDMPTEMGLAAVRGLALANAMPLAYRRCGEAGAVIVGKTVTTEFAAIGSRAARAIRGICAARPAALAAAPPRGLGAG